MFVHNFDPVLIDLGLLKIRWYSIAYILGILGGWIYAIKIIKITTIKYSNFNQIKQSSFDDLIIYLIIGIILGGRFGYVVFYNFEYYSQNLLEIFKIWHGGMSFHGGLLGVVISVFFYSNKTKTNFFKYSDIISCVAPIGIFLGRISNFINGELYGKISTLPWAVIFQDLGFIGLIKMLIFMVILVLGFVYLWIKGDLDWVKMSVKYARGRYANLKGK